MPSYREQMLFEAPVETVWELLSNPSRYPDWGGDTLEVTGVPTRIEKGSTYDAKTRGRLGTNVTTFAVAELDELKEIKLQCQQSGYYSHWLLTEARGDTFVHVEIGVEPIGLPGRALQVVESKRSFRRIVRSSSEGLRRLLERP